MKIAGLNKLTITDYPDHVACIIFTQGCNMKCPYCHNSSLIEIQEGQISEEEVFNYLTKREHILDGIVISGGEPLIQSDLKDFLRKLRKFNLKIKLDTNGLMSEKLKEIIDEKLVDYIAMDIKNEIANYKETANIKIDVSNQILTSIKLIENSNIDYEFRTTIVKQFHDIQNLINITKLLDKKSKLYFQNFSDSDGVLHKDLHGFSEQELAHIQNEVQLHFSNSSVRGLKNIERGTENV